MGNRIDDKTAEAIMIAGGWKPLVEYPLADRPWKSECMSCGKIGYPTFIAVKRGSGCRACKNANKIIPFKISDEEAINKFLILGFRAIEKIKIKKRNIWKVECLKCGIVVNKRLDGLKANKKCQNCYWLSKIMPESEALKILSDAHLKPLEAYISAKKWWKVQCLQCNSIISVKASTIKRGSGCQKCAKNGFSINDPAYLYLITHKDFNSHKIGVGNSNNRHDRIKILIGKGWTIYKIWHFDTGKEAINIETNLFRIIRKDLKLPIHLKNISGSTETIDADLISLEELENLVNRQFYDLTSHKGSLAV